MFSGSIAPYKLKKEEAKQVKTVNIETAILREIKLLCIEKDTTIQDFVNTGLRKVIKNEQRKLDKAS